MNQCKYQGRQNQERAKTVLITGGAGGIGMAISQQFIEQGYNVAINYYHNTSGANRLVERLNQSLGTKAGLEAGACVRKAAAYQADITNKQAVEAMICQIQEDFGEINVLVNNAGLSQQKLFTDISETDWQQIFDVNVKGAFYCCQAVLPPMIRSKRGKIINVSSMWGVVGASCEVHYSAAKAAIIGLTKALAKELGPSHIQVNCVAPGLIDTGMNAHVDPAAIEAIIEETPLGRIGSAVDIAQTIAFLASDQSDFITGQIFNVNGGLVIV